MFKKLKDKLAEEVKSSPQRIQQFAQAAQAAVTSASSSISDITNSDLFSIGDNDSQQSRGTKSQSSMSSQPSTFQDVSLVQPLQSPSEMNDYMTHDILENQRQRRLSNSSFASDVSFRLPSYETPSMYHLQSDVEVSASEAEERGFSSGTVSLDRVTKEQLYAAYRRTQERYTKYRTQYGDLARHYKLLERENAKARSVLVETQDKALRRISELREQCSLEQSAKAHLEKALRIELEEKNIKIDTLTTKIQLLQADPQLCNSEDKNDNVNKNADNANEVQLINLSNDNENKPPSAESLAEISVLTTKIEKMEQLLNKYKESLKASKEKNSQVTTELQILSNELESKNREVEQLKNIADDLAKANEKIQDLNNLNEELQNKINVYEFTKTREQSTLEIDLQKAQEEVTELRSKIEVFSKREEEYAISLAENKLSIHKELESKEAEIKSLKDSLDATKKEIQSLNIVVNEYKHNAALFEAERQKHNNECNELASTKTKMSDLETQVEEYVKKCQSLEQAKTKADEEYKCLQLQMKQETAEKLAMIDRNMYLENKNTQLSEENTKKSLQISGLEKELQKKLKDLEAHMSEDSERDEIVNELSMWKDKYAKLESEIQEERDELIKLQSEIEKLLSNHERLQTQNFEFHKIISDLESNNKILNNKVEKYSNIEANYKKLITEVKDMRKLTDTISNCARDLQNINKETFAEVNKQISETLIHLTQMKTDQSERKYNELEKQNAKLQIELKDHIEKYATISDELSELQKENKKWQAAVNEMDTKDNMVSKELNILQEENDKMKTKINESDIKYNTLSKELSSLEDEYNKLQTEVQESNIKYNLVSNELNSIKDENNKLQTTLHDLHIQHNIVSNELSVVKDENNKLQDTLNEMDVRRNEVSTDLNIVKDENVTLQATINELDLDKKHTSEKLNALTEEYESNLIELSSVKERNTQLRCKVSECESKIDSLQIMVETERTNYLTTVEKLNIIKNEKTYLEERNQDMQEGSTLASTELEKIKNEHKSTTEACSILRSKIDTLTKDLDSRNNNIEKLQEDIKNLTFENVSLKGRAETIATSFANMEDEINELRKSHTDMEKEKDRLNEVIEKLESVPYKTTLDRIIQTDDASDSIGLSKDLEYETALVSSPSLARKNLFDVQNEVSRTSQLESMQKKTMDYTMQNNAHLENYNTLKNDYDLLKEENRRYMSDIEGLQTYLTKISKENSVLNDKLRELIATSEHSTENNDVNSDLWELKGEVQISKDKIDDLLRENSLLIEENLELKDQLQSQNYPQPDVKTTTANDADDSGIKEKYNNLLQANSSLEGRMLELEQMNKSVNLNMVQTQEKNEKLRSSNEKLERRLDEALVSLRHLHSLQENTELEYLRNILYEYLTGSGTHSVTLAKVLAAIVKFDDMQTKLVLQKEKERQGFLRQLGII